MAFSGNNQTVYNAAFDGAMAGMVAGRPINDAVQADYNAVAAVATIIATKVDAAIPTDANLSTGAGGTTIDPVAGVTTASLNAKSHLAFALTFGAFNGRFSTDVSAAAQTAINVIALAIAAAYAASVAAYANAPGGTSLT